MNVMYKEGMAVPAKIWAELSSIESGALDQVKNVASLPFAFRHVSLMPDAHVGFGCPIGTVAALENVIVPGIVGVDIGCGMCALRTNLTEIDTETLKKIMGQIRETVPVGNGKGGSHADYVDTSLMPPFKYDTDDSCPVVKQEFNAARKQIGTLGGGNHFIEIQKGSDGFVWIMLHSGSRHLGKMVADYYNKLAVKLNEKWKSGVPKSWELAFLPLDSTEGQAYMAEMQYCVDYALANRKLMMQHILNTFCLVLGSFLLNTGPESMINIAHNYAAMEHHFGKNVLVHRKGATRARLGEIGIIPGSQGTQSYIVRGLGNKESFESCSHGAGRLMSRTKARNTLVLEDEIARLDVRGIIHGIRNQGDLDEAASAYKPIEEVMANQTDLVEVVTELTPLAVIKG